MYKKIARKINLGLIVSGVSMLIFTATAVYLLVQIQILMVDNGITKGPMALVGLIMMVFYYCFLSLVASLIFGSFYLILELITEQCTKKPITKNSRACLLFIFIILVLFGAFFTYKFELNSNRKSIIQQKQIIEYGIKKNTINLSKNQRAEIYSKKLDKYGLPGNSKNFFYSHSNIGKSFLWGQDEFLIEIKNSNDIIVLKNVTQGTVINYSINKYYPPVYSLAFDVFMVTELTALNPERQRNTDYFFVRAELGGHLASHNSSLFLAFNKNGELLYEELVNGLDN